MKTETNQKSQENFNNNNKRAVGSDSPYEKLKHLFKILNDSKIVLLVSEER